MYAEAIFNKVITINGNLSKILLIFLTVNVILRNIHFFKVIRLFECVLFFLRFR